MIPSITSRIEPPQEGRIRRHEEKYLFSLQCIIERVRTIYHSNGLFVNDEAMKEAYEKRSIAFKFLEGVARKFKEVRGGIATFEHGHEGDIIFLFTIEF